MQLNDIFPKRYARAEELQGKEVTLTIHRVRTEQMRMKDGTKTGKYVIEFDKTEKLFVLNKTNANAIAEALGEKKAVNWTGKRITLFPTQCDAFGKTADCIRVKGAV